MRHLFPQTIAAIILACGLLASETRADSDPPNILLLLADDMRSDAIGAWGNAQIRTPHIDTLVNRGVSFRRARCMGSIHGAVCVPSRAMLLGGRTLFRTNMELEGQTTFPQLLGQNGYATFATGKWHNGQKSFLRSFCQGKSIMFGGMSDHLHVPIHDVNLSGQTISTGTGEAFSSELFANEAVEFLNDCSAEQPFFCYVSFTAPHDPRMPPQRFAEMYRQSPPPLPANFLPVHPFDTGQMTVRDELLAGWPRTESVIRQQLAEYYGMITHLDEQIGRILQALQDSGLNENTIVIFASDHGLAMGSHGLLGKQSLYEHSMRSPLVIVGPGISGGIHSHERVYLHDLFPTICDWAGVAVPDDVEGISLRGVIDGTRSDLRKSMFTAYARFGRAIERDGWKLIRWPQVNRTQLFNLTDDPHEMNDLYGQPEYEDRVNLLLGDLVDWQSAVDDFQPLWVAGARDNPVDLSNHERKPDRWQPKWIVDKYFDDDNENRPEK